MQISVIVIKITGTRNVLITGNNVTMDPIHNTSLQPETTNNNKK